MPRWETALLPWDLICCPGKLHGKGTKSATNKRISRLLDRSGPRADSVKTLVVAVRAVVRVVSIIFGGVLYLSLCWVAWMVVVLVLVY